MHHHRIQAIHARRRPPRTPPCHRHLGIKVILPSRRQVRRHVKVLGKRNIVVELLEPRGERDDGRLGKLLEALEVDDEDGGWCRDEIALVGRTQYVLAGTRYARRVSLVLGARVWRGLREVVLRGVGRSVGRHCRRHVRVDREQCFALGFGHLALGIAVPASGPMMSVLVRRCSEGYSGRVFCGHGRLRQGSDGRRLGCVNGHGGLGCSRRYGGNGQPRPLGRRVVPNRRYKFDGVAVVELKCRRNVFMCGRAACGRLGQCRWGITRYVGILERNHRV